MDDLAEILRHTVETEEPLLRVITDAAASASPGPGRWSGKQELGHLLDSAVNNRLRFVKAALEGRFEGASYDPQGWVDLGGYNQMPWSGLVDLWKGANLSLAILISRIPDDRRSAECRIGESLVASLEFVVNDYVQHVQHHLDHILGREHVRSYASAKK